MVWCVWKWSIMGKRIWIYPIILKGTRFSTIFRQNHLTGWLQPKHLLECGSSKTSQTRSQRPGRRRSRCIGRSSCGRSLAQLIWSGMSWDDENVKTCQNIQKTETSWRVDVNWLTPRMALSMHTHVQYYIIIYNIDQYCTIPNCLQEGKASRTSGCGILWCLQSKLCIACTQAPRSHTGVDKLRGQS